MSPAVGDLDFLRKRVGDQGEVGALKIGFQVGHRCAAAPPKARGAIEAGDPFQLIAVRGLPMCPVRIARPASHRVI